MTHLQRSVFCHAYDRLAVFFADHNVFSVLGNIAYTLFVQISNFFQGIHASIPL